MILSGKNIKKSFYSDQIATPVLKGVDLEIGKGEFVTIMGKSGSGKSTLLNILSTLDTCDEGQVNFDGQMIHELADEEAAKLRRETFGFVFQLPRMVKNLSLLDNILLPSLQYQKDRAGATAVAKQLMVDIGIGDLADKRLSQVSGGQLQRAGICRALINQPRLIFADEPTGALDSKTGQDVMALFKKFHQVGKTILLVTHDINVAAQSQRVLFMKDGLLHEDIRLGNNETENLKALQAMIDRNGHA